jgi:hypothetical protein
MNLPGKELKWILMKRRPGILFYLPGLIVQYARLGIWGSLKAGEMILYFLFIQVQERRMEWSSRRFKGITRAGL